MKIINAETNQNFKIGDRINLFGTLYVLTSIEEELIDGIIDRRYIFESVIPSNVYEYTIDSVQSYNPQKLILREQNIFKPQQNDISDEERQEFIKLLE